MNQFEGSHLQDVAAIHLDPIPFPVGNVGALKLPDAMCFSDTSPFWWYIVGTLIGENDQLFSFKSVLNQIYSANEIRPGFSLFNFAFQDGNYQYFIDNTYGGEDQIVKAMAQSLCTINPCIATQDRFLTEAYTVLDDKPIWQFITAEPAIPQPPFYAGKVGQPGHQYNFTVQGHTFIYNYNQNGNINIANYNYKLNMLLLDERGVVNELWNGNSTLTDSSEISLPRLKVEKWIINLDAEQDILPDGFKSSYLFSGNDGMVWADQEYINYASNSSLADYTAILPEFIQQELPELAQQFGISTVNNNAVHKHDVKTALLADSSWVVVQFNEGIYKGSSMVHNIFWNKTISHPDSQTTDDYSWCVSASGILYTGILPNNIMSAYTIPDILLPGNPGIGHATIGWQKPFQLNVTEYADEVKYDLLFPWITGINLTINADSAARYALANYAHKLNSSVKDNPTQPITFNLKAIFPFTQSIMYSKKLLDTYEGAGAAIAVDTRSNAVVGTAWLEHILTLPN